MKIELEKNLVEKYPDLYKDYGGDPKTTCMAWGFECGDGWYDLIDELSFLVAPYGVVAIQVKEKFGGFRFYYRGPSGMSDEDSETVEKIVDEYEERSYHICEICGEPGTLSSEFAECKDCQYWQGNKYNELWMYVRCTECNSNKRRKENEKWQL